MGIKRSLVLFFSSYGCFLLAQEKTIDTIYVFDNQMSRVKLFHPVKTISAEEVEKTQPTFPNFSDFNLRFILKKMAVERFLLHLSEELLLSRLLLYGTASISILIF